MKATPGANFTIDRAWERVPGLVVVYVFDVATRPVFNLLSYDEAFRVAASWTDLTVAVAWNDPKRGNHDWSSISSTRMAELAPFADRWTLITGPLSAPLAP